MSCATEQPGTSSGSETRVLGLLAVNFCIQSGGCRDRLNTATRR